MADVTLSDAEIVRRGRGIYDAQIRAKVEPQQDGRFVAIDIESGDYEVADAAVDAMDKLEERRPNALFYVHRVGRVAAYALGATARTRP